MYSPDAFAETDRAEIDRLIEAARLGLLITHGSNGLFATHLPFLYDASSKTLTGHIARANPQPTMAGDGEALVVLSGPDAYVSPRWYVSSARDGRHVPTWNYEAVHVYGRLTWFEGREPLLSVVRALTERHEAHIAPPWSVDEADTGYVDRLLGAIVGLRIEIVRIEAKRKLSQNRPAEDRTAVIAALEASDNPRDHEIAARMRRLAK
ncbi:MAG TPA: FMN-binding negative transcriptional regulator [Caulobacteraceae bacterium]|jgi:transcriptional regulator|nr:FMN-binding negative transcriptional regulator [Caulobacteraceae bacterium]